jgi:hypothetical protein
MAEYGESLDDFDFDNISFYKSFVSYFGDPRLYKIKDSGDHSVYMTKTECMLTNECRYIVAIIRKDAMCYKHAINLSSIEWVSLQTRTIGEKYNIPSHGYTADLTYLPYRVRKTKDTAEATVYSSEDFPIKVVILNKRNSSMAYQNEITIAHALETFSAIISFE